MSRFSQMLGIVYTEPNEESETMNAQIENPDIEVQWTDETAYYPSQDVEKEITVENFLELEEFLELEDREQLGDFDSSREVIMEDFLELEEWLDSEQKLDDERNVKRKDLETSSKISIDRQQRDEIDRHPPYIADQRPPYIIDRHPLDSIELHPPDCIDRHPWLDELPGYIVELEPVEERMYMSKASHLAFPKHQRPPIWTEEAVGFHKRVKMIHDHVKILVPCDVFEAESPIPPDKSIQLSSYSGVFNDHICVENSQRRGLRFSGEVDNGPIVEVSSDTNKPASIDITTSPSIDTGRESEQNDKSRVHIRCFSQPFAKLRALLIPQMIDKGEESMEEAFTQE
ncbi:hypothetical protein F2Q69_00035926 [Brassica cretica]|uniref:Uncharacterized protein n=1 Tax=Brassica cretica TaxID=69181 RepID=A0A8S9SSH7_BRACR|nr:hypothetical protein F2Q69_00035926 [Brassica cretica]